MLKKYLLLILVAGFVIAVHAQIENPVKWSYAATKKSANQYEIVITATLPKPWHIYSQKTPDGGPKPTQIVYKKNPLLIINGAPKENGTLKIVHDVNFGVDVKYYSDKVEFIQAVQLRTAAKTTISGTVDYMVCNDEKCLPPARQPFDIKLN